MYAGSDFSPFDTAESDTFGFDFAKRLVDGATIVGATWYCTVAADSALPDANAADHVGVPAQFSGSITTQHVSGLVAGVKYALQAVVETSDGNTLSLWSHVLCTDPG